MLVTNVSHKITEGQVTFPLLLPCPLLPRPLVMEGQVTFLLLLQHPLTTEGQVTVTNLAPSP